MHEEGPRLTRMLLESVRCGMELDLYVASRQTGASALRIASLNSLRDKQTKKKKQGGRPHDYNFAPKSHKKGTHAAQLVGLFNTNVPARGVNKKQG